MLVSLPDRPATEQTLRTPVPQSHLLKQRMKTSSQEDEEGVCEFPFNHKILGVSDPNWGTMP